MGHETKVTRSEKQTMGLGLPRGLNSTSLFYIKIPKVSRVSHGFTRPIAWKPGGVYLEP